MQVYFINFFKIKNKIIVSYNLDPRCTNPHHKLHASNKKSDEPNIAPNLHN